jgi:hypothetical protein
MGRSTMKARKKTASNKTIKFNYIKTNNYRTYHVDGVFGGLTAHRKIYMELFLERAVTPQSIDVEVRQDGTLGEEVSRTGKEGLVREIEAGAIMDVSVAEGLRDWLDEKIKQYKEKTGQDRSRA